MIRNYPIHPFLFAIFVVLNVCNTKNNWCTFLSVASAIIIVSACILLLFGSLYLCFRYSHKAGVFSSFFCIWFFSYNTFISLLAHIAKDRLFLEQKFLILYWLGVLALGTVCIIRARLNCFRLTKYLNIVSGIALLLAAAQITWDSLYYQGPPINDVNHMKTNIQRSFPIKKSFPDIYYIILDGYSGNKELKRILGFENSEFTTFLLKKGFYIASDSHSNYTWTGQAMASSLNMQYLEIEPDKMESNIFRFRPGLDLGLLVSNSSVIKFLISKGYRFYNLSIWPELSKMASYNSTSPVDVSNLWQALLSMSILQKPVVSDVLVAKEKRKTLMEKFEELFNIPFIHEPTFTYAHFLTPHEPYVFDRKGNMPSIFRRLLHFDERQLYVEQLIYTNSLVEEAIEVILSRSDPKPIIVIQGDHGGNIFTLNQDDYVKLRTSILNAYFMPLDKNKLLYDSISPVNSFRVIFNHYFNTNYELLPDKSYYHASGNLKSNSRVILVNESTPTQPQR